MHPSSSLGSDDRRKQQIQLGLERKIECEKNALSIVERIAAAVQDDGGAAVAVTREWLRDAAKFLTPTYYDDSVDERHCSKLCGYPTCANRLENIPQQTYHISAKNNKVYDITERKKYCNNICYKSSQFYREQLLTSPLWLRQNEESRKIIFLDEVESSHQSSGKGLHVNLQKAELEPKTCPGAEAPDPNSSLNLNCNDISEHELLGQLEDLLIAVEPSGEGKAAADGAANCNEAAQAAASSSSAGHIIVNEEREIASANGSSLLSAAANAPPPLIVLDASSAPTAAAAAAQFRPRHTVRKKKPAAAAAAAKSPLDAVLASVREWYTIDTARLLHGDEHVKVLLREHGCTLEKMTAVVGDHSYRPQFRKRYIDLCRKLDLQELEDSHLTSTLLQRPSASADAAAPDDGGKKLKPLPSYEKLREETEEEELKIAAYFKGKTLYEKEVKRKKKALEILEKDEDEDGEEREPVLPLVDKHAQDKLRKRIVNEQLDMILADILKIFGLSRCDINDVWRNLVSTFIFSAHNIVFKPREWALIAILMLLMLSTQNGLISSRLENREGKKYLSVMLLSYGTNSTQMTLFLSGLASEIHYLLYKLN